MKHCALALMYAIAAPIILLRLDLQVSVLEPFRVFRALGFSVSGVRVRRLVVKRPEWKSGLGLRFRDIIVWALQLGQD